MSEEDSYDPEVLKEIQSFLSGSLAPTPQPIQNVQQQPMQQTNYHVYNQQQPQHQQPIHQQQPIQHQQPIQQQQQNIQQQPIQSHVNINSQPQPMKTVPINSNISMGGGVHPQYKPQPQIQPQYKPNTPTPITASTVINKPSPNYQYTQQPTATPTGVNNMIRTGTIPTTGTTAGYPSTPGYVNKPQPMVQQVNTAVNPQIRYTPGTPVPTQSGVQNIQSGTYKPIAPQGTNNTGITGVTGVTGVIGNLPQQTVTTGSTGATITAPTTTTTGQPASGQGKPAALPNQITTQIQNHFNALALAYRNNILPRNELMEHLEILFGKNYTNIYTDKIDSIPPDRVPLLPKDFDINKIKEQTPKIKDLAILNMKQNTPPGVPPVTNLPGTTSTPVQAPRPTNPPNIGIQQGIQPGIINPLPTTTTTTIGTITTPTITTTIASGASAIKDLKRKKPEENKEDEKQNLKDLNDVTKIANIDMKNEADGFLPDYQEDDENYVPEAEPLFLNSIPLRKKICTIATRNGVRIAEENNVVEYISLACQDYLRTILEFLVKTSQQRLELQKDDLPSEITTDVKKKLLYIEKREKEERTRKESEENERILSEAKRQETMSKKKVENEKIPTALREKINKVKAEEEEKARTSAANTTALAAVGNIGKKKVVTNMISKSQGPPVPNPQLQTMLQLMKDGKSLAPEQIPLFQQMNSYYEKQLKLYNERVASQPTATTPDQPEPPVLKSFLPPSNIDKSKSMRRITKKDCLFSQSVIRPHILLKHELMTKTKKYNPNLSNPIPL